LVVVRDVSASTAYELALIENVQREDLNPIEFAEALDHLLKEHGHTQDSLAQRIGKDRSTLANALRLLRLPEKTRALVISGALSEGHARALLGAPNEHVLIELADKVSHGRLSVRQTEALVRDAKRATRPGAAPPGKTASVRDLENRLARRLGTECRVRDRKGRGVIAIKYSSLDELDRLLEILL
jgi:ParB family chromosome partitioning protein